MKNITSMADVIREAMKYHYESLMINEINKIEAIAIESIRRLTEEKKKNVKQEANKLVVELLSKADINGISVELKF